MPLIGAQGPGSQIAFRGNLDEFPDEFIFPEVIEVPPGESGISTEVQITGINYKALVTVVGSAASVSVTPYQEETDDYGTPGDFLPGNDSNNPIIIRNKDKLRLKILSFIASQRSDYGRNYPTTITIGTRPSSTWSITTQLIDDDPDPFFFDFIINQEINTSVSSATTTVTGIDDAIGVDIFMVSSTGELSINNGESARSGKIFDGDSLKIIDTTPNTYNTTTTCTLQIGVFTASFDHRTRVADKTINEFTLPVETDIDLEETRTSAEFTISGADENLNGNNPLPISITGGGEYRIRRNGAIIQDFTSDDNPVGVSNGDEITVRVVSSSQYSTTVNSTLTISNASSTFSVTTRPRPINTIPDQFTFTDQSGQGIQRGSTITSNEITLTGMTEFGDEGTASISSASGVNGVFKVVRGNTTVKNYSSSSFSVRNGDKITLQLTASPNSLGSASATFTVSGTNTFSSVSGVSGSTSDTWNVTSAERFCNIDSFSFSNQTGNSGGLDPGELAQTSFVASGFDFDCGMSVSTSNSNSYVKIGSRQGSSLSGVNIGDTVEVYMSTPYYDQTRTTTVTLTSSFGTSRSATWRIGPVNPPLPTITLDAENRNVPFVFPDGGSATLNFEYNFVTQSSVTTNFGLNSVAVNSLSSGSKSGSRSVSDIPAGSTTYSMTVSNSSGSTTGTVVVIVGDPPDPTITLCPSDTSSCSSTSTQAAGSNVRLYWFTTNTLSTSSSDFNTGGSQNGNVLISNLNQDSKTYTITATGAGNPAPTATASHTINLSPGVSISSNKSSIILGESFTLTWSSLFATSVVSTSGFSSSALSGSQTITPTNDGSLTFGITVKDDDGLTASDSVTVTVTEDTTPNAFNLTGSPTTGLNLGQEIEVEPDRDVAGLSPGVSVTASLSGAGARFISNNSNQISISNETTANDLRFRMTASNDYSTSRTATMSQNGVTASITIKTRACVVNESTAKLDDMSFDMRSCIRTRDDGTYESTNTCFLKMASPDARLIGRAGNGTVTTDYFYSSGSFTTPGGVTSIRCAAIGGGGGGGCGPAGKGGGGGGGGGAVKGVFSTSAGETWTVTVGGGGALARSEGEGGWGGHTRIESGNRYLQGSEGRGGNSKRGGGGGNFLASGETGGNGGNGATGDSRRSVTTTNAYYGSIGGGHGGGAGRVNGGSPGSCDNGELCGSPDKGPNYHGSGGEGSSTDGQCIGLNCQSAGKRGKDYGAGAGGGGNGKPGGTGAPGIARIDWSVNWPDFTKQDVVYTIRNAFRDKAVRPPNFNELKSYYETFRDNPSTIGGSSDLSDLRAYVQAGTKSFTGSVTDNCGNAFPTDLT